MAEAEAEAAEAGSPPGQVPPRRPGPFPSPSLPVAFPQPAGQGFATLESSSLKLEIEEDQDQDAVGGQKIINQTFLSLSQITALSEQNVEGVQKKLEEFLNFKQLKTSLKEAILLDYYTAGFWWAKEKNFSLVQLSGFMDLLNFLLENLRDKHMTLEDNIKELGKAMAGIGETDSERSGDMDVFSIEQAKAIIDYLNISLFKPYKLYEHLFHCPREEVVISNKVVQAASHEFADFSCTQGAAKIQIHLKDDDIMKRNCCSFHR
ncbi:At-rich interactive domain-containing protein 5b [Aix galericulata]|nr:At-rich interactive domain-containing protein 5b [Aix galericulata]